MERDLELLFSYVPRQLNHYEAMHPMEVLGEFFEDNSPQGHAAEWKAWRDCAAADESYMDERYGPASLLYLHQLHVKLLEALYLLLLSHEARPVAGLLLSSPEKLAEERANWSYFPNELSDEYLRNPYGLIRRCFRYISMPEYHYYLDTMLKDALSIRRNAEVNMSAHTLLRVYEEVLHLHAAAWLLHQRHVSAPLLKKEGSPHNELLPNDTGGIVVSDYAVSAAPPLPAVDEPAEQGYKRLRLMELTQALPEDRLKQLSGLCAKVIAHRLPYTKAIYLLGEAAGNLRTVFLLIIVDASEVRAGSELIELVEKCCRCFGSVTPVICNEDKLDSILGKQPYFFSKVLHEGKLLFASPYWQGPQFTLPDRTLFLQEREAELADWQPRYEGLLLLANQVFTQKDYGLTLILLNQALPMALSATIRYRTGYWVRSLNPVRLLKVSRLFTPTLAGLFEISLPIGKQRMSLLSKSYRNYIYTDGYAPEEAAVAELLNIVNRAVAFCREACQPSSE